eukprot:263769-Pleurochrysis_carterae.AAC.1
MQRATAYKLSSWEHPDGANFYAKHLKGLLRLAWPACMEVDEESRRKTLLLVPPRYRLDKIDFTKVTVACNNPTPFHTNYGNVGLTFHMAHNVSDEASGPLVGGSQILFDSDMNSSFVLADQTEGIFTVGDYSSVLHANLASRSGKRFVVACYSNFL